MFSSAVDDPAEPMVALCQSTAYAMSQGQSFGDASVMSRIDVATSEMTPITRSAIGLRSWSCGGLSVWWIDSAAQNARKYSDTSLPSWSEWISRRRGRGKARPSSSTGVKTVASKAALMRAMAVAAWSFVLMNSTKT